jgi:hypothetical protein
MIGLVSGLMNGLGISLLSKGDNLLGMLWFFMGFAVAFALYMRVLEDRKSAVKVTVRKDDEERR